LLAVLLTGAALWLGCGSVPPEEQPAGAEPTASELLEAAESARGAGDHDAAIAGYREVLARTPWNERAKSALAGSLAERAAAVRLEPGVKGIDRAIADLREARELAPGDERLRRNLAVVLVERADRTMDPAEAALYREEARALDAEVASASPGRRSDIERRLDLAQELIERGQLDAGISRLDFLLREHPGQPDASRLLAQALVRRGTGFAQRGNHLAAAAEFDRAVATYASGGICSEVPCEDPDVRLAHRNRIVAWLEAPRPDEARRALEEAEAQGIDFPELRRALAEYSW
jgi:tetratricopeptide (TPR) repeat protein